MSSPDVSVNQIQSDFCAQGEYLFSKEIGRGTYGRVFLATRISDLKIVAIKRISQKHIGKFVFPEREYRILDELRHPHIVSVLGYLKDGLYDYLVFECAEKGDLLDFVNKRAIPFSERDLISLLFQLSSAVAFIHSSFYVHLDIKLENILLVNRTRNYLEIRLCDFGFTKKYDPETKIKYNCGSEHYAAPELIFERAIVGPEADIWSLGTTIYTAATGVFLVNIKNPMSSFKEFREKGVFVPYDSFLPLKIRAIVIKMLKYNPEERITASMILEEEILKSQVKRLDLNHILKRSESSPRSSRNEETPINSPLSSPSILP